MEFVPCARHDVHLPCTRLRRAFNSSFRNLSCREAELPIHLHNILPLRLTGRMISLGWTTCQPSTTPKKHNCRIPWVFAYWHPVQQYLSEAFQPGRGDRFVVLRIIDINLGAWSNRLSPFPGLDLDVQFNDQVPDYFPRCRVQSLPFANFNQAKIYGWIDSADSYIYIN